MPEPAPLMPLVRAEAGAGAGPAWSQGTLYASAGSGMAAAAAGAAAPVAEYAVPVAGAGRPRAESTSSAGSKRGREPSVERSGAASPAMSAGASSGGEFAEAFAAGANVDGGAERPSTRQRRDTMIPSHDHGGAAAASTSFAPKPISTELRKDFDTALEHMGIIEVGAVSLDVSALYRSASIAHYGDEGHWKDIQNLVKDHLDEYWGDHYGWTLDPVEGAGVREEILPEDAETGAPFPDKTAYLNALPW